MPAPKKKIEKKKLAPVAPIVVAPVEEDDDDIEVVIRDEVDEKGKEKYYQSVGRRKEAIARVRLFTKKSTDNTKDDRALLTVNGKDYVDYFSDVNLLSRVEAPLRKLKSLNRFKATAMVNGGGLAGQADAVKHGLARALEVFDLNFRKKLKKAGFLTRDPRIKERRKYGLKKARKAPSWSKR
jgi:small subunit ribosomal protein S9